jgi:hypothetical protein
MRHFLIMGVICGLLVAIVAGCGDDDKATGPAQSTPLGYGRGVITLNPHAAMQFQIFGNGALPPNLDSIKVGDSLIDRSMWYLVAQGSTAEWHWVTPFNEDGDTSTYMYDPGDTATIRVWGEGRSSTCSVKLLNPAESPLIILSPPSFADTISQGGSDTVYWNKVQLADYYAVRLTWTPFMDDWDVDFYFTEDTSFVITGAMMPDTVIRCEVGVTPFNGPDPRTDRTNWIGNLLDGVVYSGGTENGTTIVVSLPSPGAGAAAGTTPALAPPKLSADEIVSAIYKKYDK